jgi:hypothetical protein
MCKKQKTHLVVEVGSCYFEISFYMMFAPPCEAGIIMTTTTIIIAVMIVFILMILFNMRCVVMHKYIHLY